MFLPPQLALKKKKENENETSENEKSKKVILPAVLLAEIQKDKEKEKETVQHSSSTISSSNPSSTTTSSSSLSSFSSTPPILRSAGDSIWIDTSLAEWDPNDFRMFAGNLGPEMTEDQLISIFKPKYPSLQKVKVIRDVKGESKGFGFISFADGQDFLAAIKEMDGKFVGSRPIKLKRSHWKDRSIDKKQAKKLKRELPKKVKKL